MQRMMGSGRVCFFCVWLLLALHVSLASFIVKVTPTVDVLKGQTAQLPCSHTNSKQSLVQWFIEDAEGTRKRLAYRSNPGVFGVDRDTPFSGRVNIEDDNTLVISDVKVMDERKFICQVNAGVVGTSEAETELKVFFAPEKPVMDGNKQAITLSHGEDDGPAAEVGTCISYNGYPMPRIVWFKDSIPLPEETDEKEKLYMAQSVIKESTGLFTVKRTLYMKLSKADAKSLFHCTVEYKMPNEQFKNDTSEKFNVSMLYPAENAFFELMNQEPIKEGDEVKMNCKTDGNPQPEFEYLKNGVHFHTGDGWLILKNVDRRDAGSYMCEAQDFDALDEANLKKTLSINVHYLDPVSVEPAGPLVIGQGAALELQCKTKSSDDYFLSWMKDGQKLVQRGELSIQPVSLADAGEYVCVASAPMVPGLRKEANVTVTVSGKPEISEPMHGKVGKQGQMVTLKCSALGHPGPQFTWTPRGKESVTIEGTKYISTVTLEATAAVLKDGVTCEAANKHGTDSKKFMVEISSDNLIDGNSAGRAESQQGGSSTVVIAVVVCVLLLVLLVAALYFLSKTGKMSCGKKGKKEVTSPKGNDDIVVEMKSDEKSYEESGLLNKRHVEK
ncbi:basal cell adhesion molecule [Trichomycterus rosablanca]|uniref:basal cell adhesion molecule n=1 Tax=Trichomycterus rosablanca TaxID=2290929 RepID=UPI002F357CC3